MHLGLAEAVVLAVIDERPTHGFAVGALTGPDGELGRIWHIPRPIVYRALNRLSAVGAIHTEAVESQAGPQRTIYAATEDGHRRTSDWLDEPVGHVRQMRADFLLKLALIIRRDGDPARLLTGQHEVLTAITAALDDESARRAGFDRVLLDWRRANASAALAFVDDLTRTATRTPT